MVDMADGRNELPDLPQEYLRIQLVDDIAAQLQEISRLLPFSDSPMIEVSHIYNPVRLAYGENVKEVYSMELPSSGRVFEPGDTIGIIPCNTEEDVEKLLIQLRINHFAHRKCKIVQYRQNKSVGKPIFVDKIVTLHNLFKNYINIRCVPKKTLIRLMAEHTDNNKEKTLLEELCSRRSDKYETNILAGNVTFMDLLTSFPSCHPPVSRVLENLPILMPRPYSIGSSPLVSPDKFRIVFSVDRIGVNVKKEGLCSGMLKSIIKKGLNTDGVDVRLKMYFRKAHGFRLPNDNMCPLILVAAGTGISPFLGFLEHRKMQPTKGIIWLFYGCRYKSKDFLFKEELSDFIKDGTLTKLITSHSREPVDDVKYVQDNIRKYGEDVCRLICDENAIVYVCGEAKGMRNDVKAAILKLLCDHRGMPIEEAHIFMRNLQKAERYIQDLWV